MDFKIMGEDWKCLEMAVDKIVIRTAKPCDAEKILEIYAPYVKNTAITFEYDVPDIEEFTNRIKNTLQRYPYLLAMCGDEILGYAYTEQFKSRAAYDRAVETTIYVKMGAKNQGIGRRLYEELEKISKLQHITNMNACIGYPEIEDEYLTKNSCKFHKHMGYKLVGEFHKCGFKFGRWYNMVWMEKMVGEHTENPDEFIPFSVLDK